MATIETTPPSVSTDVLDQAVSIGQAAVVPLLQKLLGYDTDIGSPLDPIRDEAAHQAFLAGYLEGLGAEVTLFEPDASVYSHHPMATEGQTFAGRPIIWARIAGAEGGRSLLFNGHYDTVLADPLGEWTHDPRGGALVDGKVYGRGSCDMKGGIAAAVAAVEGLVGAGAELPGDIYLNFVPFEEVNGTGTIATMLAGYRADAAISCEPTELRPLVGCMGIMELQIDVEGRAGHGELVQPHHSRGGAVNAIDKMTDVLLALRRLSEEWRVDPRWDHPLLPRPKILPTVMEAGTFWATWPSYARAMFDVTFVPAGADDEGKGSQVRHEIEQHVAAAAAGDSWLREHPPTFTWRNEFPTVAIDMDLPIARWADRIAGHADGLGGFESWADHVSLSREGDIPAVILGPGSGDQAHASDEYVPVDDLLACVRMYAEFAATWGAGVDHD